MLTLQTLSSLLYGYDEFFGSRPLSLHKADNPYFRIRVIPLPLAVYIRDNDYDERLFHVEFFPKHGELWHAAAWRDSLSRKVKLSGGLNNPASADPLLDLHASLRHDLLSFFRSCRLSPSHSFAMAELLISGPERPEILQLAGLPPALADKLREYRSLCESNNPSPTPENGTPNQAT